MALVLNNVMRVAILDEVFYELCDFNYQSSRSADNGWYNHIAFAVHSTYDPSVNSGWYSKDFSNGSVYYGLGYYDGGGDNINMTFNTTAYDSHGSYHYEYANMYHTRTRHNLWMNEFGYAMATPVFHYPSAGQEAHSSGLVTRNAANISVDIELGKLNHGNGIFPRYNGRTMQWWSLTFIANRAHSTYSRQNYGFNRNYHDPTYPRNRYRSSSTVYTRYTEYGGYSYRYQNYIRYNSQDYHRVRFGVWGNIGLQGSGADMQVVSQTTDSTRPMYFKDTVSVVIPTRIT